MTLIRLNHRPARGAELRCVGGAAARLGDCLDGLEVEAAAMLSNLGTTAVDLGHAGDLVDRYVAGRRT